MGLFLQALNPSFNIFTFPDRSFSELEGRGKRTIFYFFIDSRFAKSRNSTNIFDSKDFVIAHFCYSLIRVCKGRDGTNFE